MNLPPGVETDRVLCLEANLDDLSPEITGSTVEKLLAAGALDVWLTPIQMKKSRPGVLLSILCSEDRLSTLSELILLETTTFGLRIHETIRLKLERRFETVATPYGNVSIKLGVLRGRIIQRAPEFESCRQVSHESAQPLRVIYEAALQAAQQL